MYGQLARDFIRMFGRNLPLEKDPDPDIDYTPYKVEDFPEAERRDERFRRSAWEGNLEAVSHMVLYTEHDVLLTS